ncbi:MAG: hypothetical protein PGN30_10185 [Mycolicibacterium neoaurum]|uniref:hypothetical protein n=1 Tax=Mycolicibacterium neoaurum TaxID=1795 RepID=UPI002FFB211C
MQCNIPSNPNPFLEHYLMSAENVAVMRAAGQSAADMYSAIVARDTGALAASPRVTMALGGIKNDRICADVTVGEGLPRGGYAAAHNFGIGIHPQSKTPPTPWMPQAAENDLLKTLAILDAMSR